MLIQLIKSNNEKLVTALILPLILWDTAGRRGVVVRSLLQCRTLAQPLYESVWTFPKLIGGSCRFSYHFQPFILFIRTAQRGYFCNCSTFLMLRLMSFFSDQHQFSDIRRNYKPWDGKQFCSLSLSVLLHLPWNLSFLQTHILAQSHTRTHNNSLNTACVVTNFSWALDIGMREGEKEKMKEGEKQWCTGSSEEAAHIQGAWYHLSSHLFGCLCVCSVSEPVWAQSTQHVCRLFGTVSIWSLFTPQFQVLETNHKQCA